MRNLNNFKGFKFDNPGGLLRDIKSRIHYRQILAFIQRKPFTSFFAVLAILFVLMIIGNVFFSPKPEPQANLSAPKKVNVFKLGFSSQITYQGKVEKTGVVKIVAQMPGIVSAINVSEGQQVGGGTNILSLSTNYQGGNAVSLQRQIAQDQYNNVKDTYDQQGDIIGRQKDVANKNNDNAVLLRQIAAQSASDTQALASLNKSIVDQMAQTLGNDVQNGAPQAQILAEQEQLSQFQSAMAQTNTQLNNLQTQVSGQPQAESTQQMHDIAIEQLDLQRKALDLNFDVSRLQYNLALVNEANMYPSTPIAGTVDRIFVKTGDTVSPGMPLANISGASQHLKVVVNVPQDVAKNVSSFEPSALSVGNKTIERMPSYISKDATDGNLYSIIFDLGDLESSQVTDASYISVNIPIGTADAINEDPYIPLDSVVQTQEEAFVYLVGNKDTAVVKKIQLGDIQGRYVQVLSGLPRDAQIILNRNVIEGDRIQVVR